MGKQQTVPNQGTLDKITDLNSSKMSMNSTHDLGLTFAIKDIIRVKCEL